MIIQRTIANVSGEQNGIILPLVLVFMALGLLLIAPTLGHGYSALAGTTVVESRAELTHAADSGVEDALYWLTRGKIGSLYLPDNGGDEGPWLREEYSLNEKSVYVRVARYDGDGYEDLDAQHLYLITSRAEDEGGSSRVLALVYAVPFIRYVDLDPDKAVREALEGDHFIVDGDLFLETEDASITGDVTVYGNLDLGQDATITGDVYATGDIKLGQSANIECEVICTEGNIYLGNAAEISLTEDTLVQAAEVHFLNSEGSKLVLSQGAGLTADIYSLGDLTIEMTHEDTSITGNIVVAGDLTIDMDLQRAKGTITGNLYATGNVIIKLAPPEATVDGTLHYYDDQNYDKIGSEDATWPLERVCTEQDPCDWPSPQFECSLPGENKAEVLLWQIT